jgi:hypothetical protein
MSEIRIRFESYGRYGNNMYIDNVEIYNAVSLPETPYRDSEIEIYPNPSDATFNIVLPERKDKLNMQIRDIRGLLIHSEMIDLSSSRTSYDASRLAPGIYFMSFISSEININKKIIVQ